MRNFYAINLFGFILTCGKLSKEELNHELIHSAQAKELLYIPFIYGMSSNGGFYSLNFEMG